MTTQDNSGERIVIKVGSATITDDAGCIDEEYLAVLVGQMSRLRERGVQVVLVSSGAIAAGLDTLGLDTRPDDMAALQAAASVGQVRLIRTYEEIFARHDVPVGQVLLTRHETTHRRQYLLACNTLERLLDLDVVPVVNENDTTAVDEITFGDNDSLAALVAIMIKADMVIMLSDIEGLHTADPRLDDAATLVEHVDEVTDDVLATAGGPGSTMGSGGMQSKMEAARALRKAGIAMVLCDGRRPDVLIDAAAGEPVGTYFARGEGSLAGRKLWIAFGRAPAGMILVDDGAKQALLERGTSLLPAGVVEVTGSFRSGDAVAVAGSDGKTFARGLASMGSADLERVKGRKTTEVHEMLSEGSVDEAVHRDQLVIL